MTVDCRNRIKLHFEQQVVTADSQLRWQNWQLGNSAFVATLVKNGKRLNIPKVADGTCRVIPIHLPRFQDGFDDIERSVDLFSDVTYEHACSIGRNACGA